MKDGFQDRIPKRARFMTTRWTDVLSARGNSLQARESLRELCERYYHPVHAFISAYTNHDQDSQDWTQAFFAKLLEGNSLNRLSAEQGRFRSYLLGAVKHFLADERAKLATAKRGGTIQIRSLDHDDSTELKLGWTDVPPDSYFDRQWALSILNQSLELLRSDVASTKAGEQFELLSPWLNGIGSTAEQNEIAQQMGISVEALKGVIHRWRKRYREIVKSMVSGTVVSANEVDLEIDYLIECLATNI